MLVAAARGAARRAGFRLIENPPEGSPRRRLTALALGLFLAGTAVIIALNGVPTSRDAVFFWVIVGLLTLSLADTRRWLRGVIFDWLPFVGLLFVYDFLRGAVGQDPLFQPHLYPQIDADLWLTGSVPTVGMQESLFDPLALAWYDFAAWGVYITHFFATFVVAALLWRYAYPLFRKFRALVLTVTAMAFVTYTLFPAVPPWLASDYGAIGHTERVVSEVWAYLGVDIAAAIWEKGSTWANLVAAVPSLHAAYPALITLFFWRHGWWARGLGIVYTLAMGLTLVYTGEHYVFDILLGWLYAGAAFGVVAGARAVWVRLQPAPAAVPEPRVADS
jgi:hypothetical protein